MRTSPFGYCNNTITMILRLRKRMACKMVRFSVIEIPSPYTLHVLLRRQCSTSPTFQNITTSSAQGAFRVCQRESALIDVTHFLVQMRCFKCISDSSNTFVFTSKHFSRLAGQLQVISIDQIKGTAVDVCGSRAICVS